MAKIRKEGLYSTPNSSLPSFSVLLFLVGAFISCITVTDATFDCPESCKCSLKTYNNLLKQQQIINYAECTNLDSFRGVEKNLPINSLNLTNAYLEQRVPFQILEKIRDLIELDLSYNNLSDLGKLGKRIKLLNLSHNKITSGKLRKIIPKHVEELDLSFNEISYLPLEITHLKNLRKIQLNGNALNCSCETLEVRNWFKREKISTVHQSNSNFDSASCAYPIEVKGAPFWEVSQEEICERDGKNTKQHVEFNNDNEIELMLGDQPALEETEHDGGSGNNNHNIEEDAETLDELGKDFLPISMNQNSSDKKSENLEANNDENDNVANDNDEEGSGNDPRSAMVDPGENVTDEDEDGSGSGFGPIMIPNIRLDAREDDNLEKVENSSENNGSEYDVFGPGLGIVDFSSTTVSAPSENSPSDVNDDRIDMEPAIVPVKVNEQESAVPVATENSNVGPLAADTSDVEGKGNDDGKEKENIQTSEENSQLASAGENKNTYIFLGVILLLLLALIVFVAFKRTRAYKRNKRREADLENQRSTELADMDKKNPGKPLQRNGNAEHSPLIGNLNKSDLAKPINGNKRTPPPSYNKPHEKDSKLQEPLLKKLENPENNTAPVQNGKDTAPLTREDIPPESNNNVRPLNKDGVCNEVPKITEDNEPDSERPRYEYPSPTRSRSRPSSSGNDDVFLPSSPHSGRYSPVYSHETGKVKIKLTETPKPKTPLLVTKSRSNAGDIITTPIHGGEQKQDESITNNNYQ